MLDLFRLNTHVFMYCVDLSKPLPAQLTQDNVQDMMADLKKLRSRKYPYQRNIPCVLVGTKSDALPRQVSDEEMEELCRWLEVDWWVESSAKTKEGVEEAFWAALDKAEEGLRHARSGGAVLEKEKAPPPTPKIKERASSMMEDLASALDIKEFSDVEFVVLDQEENGDEEEKLEAKEQGEEGRIIHANLVILLCRFPSLMEHLKEGQRQVVVKDIPFHIMKSLLRFIYGGSAQVGLESWSKEDVKEMKGAARKFGIFPLFFLCDDILTRLHPEEEQKEKEKEKDSHKDKENEQEGEEGQSNVIHTVRKPAEESNEAEPQRDHLKLVVNAPIYSDIQFHFAHPGDNTTDNKKKKKKQKKRKESKEKKKQSHNNKKKTKVIHAHKIVLASRCPYFHSLFLQDFKEKHQDRLQVEDVPYEAFLVLMHYLYTDQLVGLQAENVVEVLVAGDKFGLERVVEKCCNWLVEQLDVENVVAVLEVSEQLGLKELRQGCLFFMKHHGKCSDESRLSAETKEELLLLRKTQDKTPN
ncbi:Galactose oxidase, central domain [Balamuthia mandrillaris]